MQLSTALNLPNRQVSAGGFGYGASLALDLTSGNQTLDPRITFSRTSNATVTGPDGLIAYAPHNLTTYSEEFDNSAWTKTGVTVTANSDIAPNGTTTAELMLESAVTSTHRLSRASGSAYSVVSGTSYAFSIFVKNASGSRNVVVNCNSLFNAQAFFNLSTGTVASTTSGTASIVNVGNGWYRCTVIGTATSTQTATSFPVGLADSTTENYAGDGTSGIFLWGAQLNVGALQPYYTTTVKNLLGYTQEFDNAAWSKTAVTVTANTTTAPDGSTSADSIFEEATTNVHRVFASVAVTSGAVYTESFYVKANGRDKCQLEIRATAIVLVCNFDLVAQTAVVSSGSGSCSIQSVGSGWFRVSATATATGSGTGLAMFYLLNDTFGGNYLGDITKGIFIWGAQLSDSASLDPYVYNPVAAPAAAAYYGPRFDYDPVTLAPKGLLIEESRTNLLTYSEQFDNAAWVKTNATVTADAAVSPDGTADGDKLVEDTTTNEHQISGAVSVTSGTSYTVSVYVKAAERTFCRFGFTGIGFSGPTRSTFNLSTGTITSSAGGSPTITAVGNGWYRLSVTNTATSTTTATFILQPMSDSTTISYLGNGVSGLFIWGAQAEAGAFPTSYIPTTTAAATRAADVATMIGANFSNWYNQAAGTLFAQASFVGVKTGSYIVGASDGTTSNQAYLGVNPSSASFLSARVVDAGVEQSRINKTTPAANTVFKMVGAFKLNDMASSLNGDTVGTDIAATLPALNQLALGSQRGSDFYLNGHLSRIAYFPRRLADAELQAITV